MNEEESVKRIETMKYKAGDRVKIKSLDWYNKNKNKRGNISFPYEVEVVFTLDKSSYCGQVVTISKTGYTQGIGFYRIKEDYGVHMWTDEMIEGLIKEETKNNNDTEEKETLLGWVKENDSLRLVPHKDYEIKHDGDNFYLVKKKKEYPKSYEECCKVLDFCGEYFFTTYEEGTHLPENDNIVKIHPILKSVSILTKLLICRNAYWKLYGEEMGLGKPWEPDWGSFSEGSYPTITKCNDRIVKTSIYTHDCILAFPTEEIRDTFYENFKELIESCKELL